MGRNFLAPWRSRGDIEEKKDNGPQKKTEGIYIRIHGTATWHALVHSGSRRRRCILKQPPFPAVEGQGYACQRTEGVRQLLFLRMRNTVSGSSYMGAHPRHYTILLCFRTPQASNTVFTGYVYTRIRIAEAGGRPWPRCHTLAPARNAPRDLRQDGNTHVASARGLPPISLSVQLDVFSFEKEPLLQREAYRFPHAP